ncbi:ferredoxin reductase [Nocardioides sp. TRM66260-LWL]|uniref:ferredoxin reductase n=1 Tax=Nocardioides sp. TRM66260-LWL TaxID=2874478 RepID=UPI001CC391F7|nr:ferredoxin reductase [Nocardioides sp. TRM66260-LWL]MBZ5735700.1 ferredoxin reductase [Nocardioides sp. TRM66260-LWL]
MSVAADTGSPSGASTVASAVKARLMQVAEAAVTPLMPADVLDLFDPLRKGAELRARVVAVEPETADAATIVLRPGRDWAGHRPGQFLRLGVDVDGVRHWRAYSLTHGPRRDGLISVTVKAVPGGTVSPFLVHGLRPGTLVHLEQAAGEFVLPADGGRLLFVTAGSGITPVIGMLRNLFPATDAGVVRPARSAHHDIVVVHLAPSRPDTIFARDLAALDAAGAIRLVSRFDDEHGVLDVADLATLVPDLDQRATFACGPAGLLDALAAHHEARDLPLFTERFRAAAFVGDAGEGGTVTFRVGASAADATVVEADGATSLLDAGEAAGVLLPSGCRMGVCFGCVVPLREGAVRDLRNGALTVATPGETAAGGLPVQTCVSAAAGPCEIQL